MVLVAAGLGAVGCAFTSGPSAGSDNAITSAKFNKNHLIDDDVLMDDRAVTAAQIQTFLDRTPYGTQSPLAGYRDENGAPAAVLLHDAAVAYGVNPITLLVRIEMENGLISAHAAASSADGGAVDSGLATPVPDDLETKIDNAFNCGRVLGLEAQAGCATRAVARAMMLLKSGQEANGGWKRGVALKTQDNVLVTPVNAATAAIYVYTPYAGESGGGTRGVAGAAGHMGIWDMFAKALRYKGATCPHDAGGCASDDAGNGDTDGGSVDIDAGDTDAGAEIDAGSADAGHAAHDAGAVDASPPPPPADAGKDRGKDAGAGVPGSGDDDGAGAGHKTPTGSSSGSSGGTYGGFSPSDDSAEGDDAGSGNTGSAPKKGCSTSGGSTGDAGTAGICLAIALAFARRRRAAV